MGRIKRVTITMIMVLSLGFAIIISSFGSALFQEGNPLPLIVSAFKLQLSDSEYVQFAKTEKRSRYLSENHGNDGYNIVKQYMNDEGWMFQEQMGSGLIFTKNGEDAVVVIRQYSKHYFIWEIQKAFFN